MEHEDKFVIGSNEPHEEVGHEEHVEEEVKLHYVNVSIMQFRLTTSPAALSEN